MDLSVIVVTYNSSAHIAQCLASVEQSRGARVTETLVVDNASADDTAGRVRREAPGVRVIAMDENAGYARAVNRGLAESTGGFAFVLNPDCVVHAGAIDALHGWMLAHPRCAIAGPRLLDPDGSVQLSARAFPDPFTFLFNRYSLLTRLWPGNPWSRRYLLSDWDHASDRSVDWLSGAALFVRRAAIAEVGVMDEAFFMFNEDIDWCHRMKDAGWSVDFVSAASVTHAVGASRSRVSERVILERHRGMIRYLRKHHPLPAPIDGAAAAFIMLRARLMLVANALRH